MPSSLSCLPPRKGTVSCLGNHHDCQYESGLFCRRVLGADFSYEAGSGFAKVLFLLLYPEPSMQLLFESVMVCC